MRFFRRKPEPECAPKEPDEPKPPRTLFLDDDPGRAETFLAANPHALWVQTVEDCLAKLAESWDEVHLDHDLGGEQFVDLSREDCGMEVVRWLCLERRPHLEPTRFFVHSHNPTAAAVMGMQLMMNGFHVEVRPFGAPELPPEAITSEATDELAPYRTSLRGWFSSWIDWARKRVRGEVPTRFGYDYTATRVRRGGDGEPAELPPLDFDWAKAPRRKRQAGASEQPTLDEPPAADPGPSS
jgi:hypothetical protein